MNTDELALAVREITETQQLLESLLTSSESFDYPKAKETLKALQKKARELRRIQTQMQKMLPPLTNPPPNVHVIDFKAEAQRLDGGSKDAPRRN